MVIFSHHENEKDHNGTNGWNSIPHGGFFEAIILVDILLLLNVTTRREIFSMTRWWWRRWWFERKFLERHHVMIPPFANCCPFLTIEPQPATIARYSTLDCFDWQIVVWCRYGVDMMSFIREGSEWNDNLQYWRIVAFNSPKLEYTNVHCHLLAWSTVLVRASSLVSAYCQGYNQPNQQFQKLHCIDLVLWTAIMAPLLSTLALPTLSKLSSWRRS